VADYLPVMISVDHPYPEIEKWIADRFEALNGTELFIVRRDMLPADALVGHLGWSKAWLWDVVPKTTQRILFIDFDVIPLRPLPEIPDAPFVAAPDAQWFVDKMRMMYPALDKAKHTFNSGFFVARRDTQPCFDQLKTFTVRVGQTEPYILAGDQTPLNILIASSFDIHWLPATFNCLAHTNYKEVSEAYLLHLPGMPNPARWSTMHLLRAILGINLIDG